MATLTLLALAGLLLTGSTPGVNPTGPRITAAWGKPTDGREVTLVGFEFGSHTLQISSGAGADGWIESNRAGTGFDRLRDARGWDVGEASGKGRPEISADRARTGQHSVLGRVDAEKLGNWQSVLRYHHDQPFDSVYATWWVYWDPIRVSPHRNTQWKVFRLNHNGTVKDQNGQFLTILRYEPAGDVHSYQAVFFCALDCPQTKWLSCPAKAVADPRYDPLNGNPANFRFLNRAGAIDWAASVPTPRQWNRMEMWVYRSEVDEADGGFEFWITKPDAKRFFIDRQRGHATRISETGCRNPADPWEYVQIQNYFDDDGSAKAELFAAERADFFYDDIYLQFGTQARVELGDEPTYSDCSRVEVQTPLAWADEELRFQLHHGGFPAGSQVYLFVVRDDGEASPGYPLTLR